MYLLFYYQNFTSDVHLHLCRFLIKLRSESQIYIAMQNFVKIACTFVMWRYCHLGSRNTSAQSEKVWYDTKLVATATSLQISEKEVQIDHLHQKHFRSVKRLRKSVRLILR